MTWPSLLLRRLADSQNIVQGELAAGTRPVGRPTLQFKDMYKRHLKACRDINPADWESSHSTTQQQLETGCLGRDEEGRGEEGKEAGKEERVQAMENYMATTTADSLPEEFVAFSLSAPFQDWAIS